ncbi:hypothetical protein Bbelb_051210 [Branchiostoma belcheri]|nr:hypothetical protein Bbelb_051210 [Branchiostoma belcheri]
MSLVHLDPAPSNSDCIPLFVGCSVPPLCQRRYTDMSEEQVYDEAIRSFLGKLTSLTGTQPLTNQTGTQPLTSQTGTQPLTSQTGTQPLTSQTGTQPLTSQAGTQPLTSQTGTQPLTSQTGTQPLTSQAGTQPLTSQTGTQPLTSQTGTQPLTSQTGTLAGTSALNTTGTTSPGLGEVFSRSMLPANNVTTYDDLGCLECDHRDRIIAQLKEQLEWAKCQQIPGQ